uniref:Death domain-containing protein n=1 Tax=Branchiostoma floridae TaxID=7739 RepID=C3ZPW8_BRAFL|eukprot:XP_002589336.1 hypothetical protein BRAFLDRAFT_77788 [Branchiostoma floridae]
MAEEGQRMRSPAGDVQECFGKVISEVSNKWDDLARELGFNENQIKGIETLKADQDRMCREMLHRWRNREGSDATLQVLKQALINIEERLIAESLEGKNIRQKKKRKRKQKAGLSQEEDSSEDSHSSSVGNDAGPGPAPSHTYFLPVAKAVGSSWVKFAEDQLGLTAQDIHAIQLSQPYSKQHQALQALELWRDRRGRKACRVKLEQALRRGGFQLTAVSNGMKQRVIKKQRTEENGNEAQHLYGETENGSMKKQTAPRSRQCHATSGSLGDSSEDDSKEQCTAGSDTFRQSNSRLKRKKKGKKKQKENISVKRKKVKIHDSRDTADDDLNHVNGEIATNDTKTAIHSTFLKIHEKVFDEKTVQDVHEFERCMDSVKKIESVISDTEEKQHKLQSAAKLRIKKRINNKIAEVAENMFSDRVLDPANRETFHKMAECFKRFGASVKKAKRGCVLCYLDFPDVGDYDTFWRGYSDGSLSDTLTRELITDDMRAAEGGADLYIHVRVLDSSTKGGDFSYQDPSGTAGRGPPHPGASREHSGQGPPAPGSSNHGDDTPTSYHGDDTGRQQVSGGGDVIQVKQEPAELVPSCCMMGTVKSEMDTNGLEVKEESELDRQFAAIADHLGSMWERLASSLGFNTDYIRDLTARLPPSLRPHQLICDWMERNLGDVTLEQLVQALRDAGIHEVADAADSGQLFPTETDCEAEAAKGKPNEDVDTANHAADKASPRPLKQKSSESSSSSGSSSSDEKSDNIDADSNDDEVGTTELFQKDVDDGSLGSEWKGQDDKGDGSSSHGEAHDEPMGSSSVDVQEKQHCNLCELCYNHDGDSQCPHTPLQPQETQVIAPECNFTKNLYPTGEDALAWDDCLQDFFKTAEDTARSIKQSWPILYLLQFLPQLPNLQELALCVSCQGEEEAEHINQLCGVRHVLKKLKLKDWSLDNIIRFSIQMLQQLSLLEEIDLSHNAISDEAVLRLAQGLGSCRNLRTVNLSNNNISNKGALILLQQQFRVGVKNNDSISADLQSLLTRRTDASQVTKLNLKSGEYFWRDVPLPLPITAVHLLLKFLPQLPNLQELALCVSCQGEEGAEHISQLYGVRHVLKKLKLKDWSLDSIMRLSTQMIQHLSLLEEIDLSHNVISDEAVPSLAEGLGSCQKLKKVNLSHNKLSGRGDFLPPLPSLEEIDLSYNAISDEAVPGLAEGLGSCQNLKKVNLSHNKLSDRGDFLPPLPNLEEIDLSHNIISDEAVPGLAGSLGSCQNLKKVDLSHNKLSDRGHFLPPLPNLEEIDLSYNAIGDEAEPGLAEGLGSCQKLKKVNLSHNKLSDVGELTAAFIDLPFLTHVDIYNNSFSDESLPTIAAWLKVRTEVERVWMRGNRFSAEGVRDFVRTMKGKAYRGFPETLLYDGSQADVGRAVESGGEDVRREEQQWETLKRETGLIRVEVGQLQVWIDHTGRRSNNLQQMPQARDRRLDLSFASSCSY